MHAPERRPGRPVREPAAKAAPARPEVEWRYLALDFLYARRRTWSRRGMPAGPGDKERTFVVRVRRDAPPPLAWTWAIHEYGNPKPHRRSVRGYRTAEEAWEAGRAALARLELRSDPGP